MKKPYKYPKNSTNNNIEYEINHSLNTDVWSSFSFIEFLFDSTLILFILYKIVNPKEFRYNVANENLTN